MAEICEAITLKVVVPPPIILTVDFKGEFLSSSDGEDYKRGYEEGHAQGLIDGRADGYQSGYDEGHKVGSESGYSQGKQDGLTEGYNNGYTQGKADGYKDGYDEGYTEGYNKGYEDGKAEGNIVDPAIVKQAQLMYMSRSMSFTDNTTLTYFELDCTDKTSFMNSFTRCTNLTDIKITNTGNVTNWTYTFYMCSSLVNLEELDFSSGTNLQACFNGCSKLVNLKVVPESIKKSVDFSYSPLLSDDSIQFIVDGYADMTGQTAPVLTVHPTVKAKIEADDAKEDTDPTKRYWLKTLTSKNVTLA